MTAESQPCVFHGAQGTYRYVRDGHWSERKVSYYAKNEVSGESVYVTQATWTWSKHVLPEEEVRFQEYFWKEPSRLRLCEGHLGFGHVLRVIDAGYEDHRPFFVTDAARKSFDNILVPGRGIEPRYAASIVGEVALGLSAMHNAGLVHLDVHPENTLLMPDGHIKICDLESSRYIGQAITPAERRGPSHFRTHEKNMQLLK